MLLMIFTWSLNALIRLSDAPEVLSNEGFLLDS